LSRRFEKNFLGGKPLDGRWVVRDGGVETSIWPAWGKSEREGVKKCFAPLIKGVRAQPRGGAAE